MNLQEIGKYWYLQYNLYLLFLMTTKYNISSNDAIFLREIVNRKTEKCLFFILL